MCVCEHTYLYAHINVWAHCISHLPNIQRQNEVCLAVNVYCVVLM